jgi:hypothetical protein
LVTGIAPVTDQVLQMSQELLITHIRNEHEITAVITTNHRSREMAISLGPQRTLVTGTKTKSVTVTQHQRCIL